LAYYDGIARQWHKITGYMGIRMSVNTCVILAFFFLVNLAIAEEPVVFGDAKLKTAVEEALKKKEPTPADMLKLEILPEIYGFASYGLTGIHDLSGLEHARNLQMLAFESSQIVDFSPLSKLENLQSLMLVSCEISDVSSVVRAIQNLDKLESLSLKNNRISDIAPVTGLRHLITLNLQGNTLDEHVFNIQIPQIRKNNPDINIWLDFRREQLVIPSILFSVLLLVAIVIVARHYISKGWIYEIMIGLVSAGVGSYFGMGAQLLYSSHEELIFFGNGIENPLWVGGVVGGIFGFFAGVWFVQYLRRGFNAGQTMGILVGKGFVAGIVLGILCSTIVHVILMVAYRNGNPLPMLIGGGFGIVTGLATGLVGSVAFVLIHRMGLIKKVESV
jgi:hypothetical protein